MLFVCYYAIPREGRPDCTMKFLPVEAIDPFLCTHIIVAFARIKENLVVPEAEGDEEIYKKLVKLKEQNPHLKVLLSLGGGSTDGGFRTLVRDPRAVVSFASTTREFLLKYGFDGLDVDWEFPAWPTLKRDRIEKQLFTQLICHLHQSLKLSPPLLLTIAVAAPKTIIDRSYEVGELVKFVDFVCLMGYDYHIFWPYLPFTGHNSPLFSHKQEKFYFATMNIEWSSLYWIKKGMLREKLVIGIPTYGRTWRLLNSSWCKVGSPAVGKGMLKGCLSFPEAKVFVNDGAKECYDEERKASYAVKGKDWVSYENCKSISEKTLWIKSQEFAGVMTWNLNCDDWSDEHPERNFELHRSINEILFKNVPQQKSK